MLKSKKKDFALILISRHLAKGGYYSFCTKSGKDQIPMTKDVYVYKKPPIAPHRVILYDNGCHRQGSVIAI